MVVCIEKVICLSIDKDNERFYPSKVCMGDIVTLFLIDGTNIQGRISSIKTNYIVLADIYDNRKKNTFYLKDIVSFNRDFRGDLSKMYF